jgi:hypothetical protein
MKRMIFAGLLALGCLAGSQREASACWGNFSFGAGFYMSWECPGVDFSFHCRCIPPPSCGYGYCPAPALPPSGFNPGWYGYAQSYTAPQGQGQAAAGYTDYGAATHFYTGYQQAPAYWYH